MLRSFWYSKPNMSRGNVINFGDELSHLLLHEISGQKIKWIWPEKQTFYEKTFTKHILAIGSILHFGEKNSMVWGSGLIKKSSKSPATKYFAVRGKYTREELMSRGHQVPEIYGDPGLLIPKYFEYSKKDKKFKIGIIPHYVEYDQIEKMFFENSFSSEFKMIDLRKPVNQILREINQCESIISSSLHGIIVPQAYNIPTLRVSFTDQIIGDGIKYEDYFDSVGIDKYKVQMLSSKDFNENFILKIVDKNQAHLQIKKDLVNLQDKLLKAKPF